MFIHSVRISSDVEDRGMVKSYPKLFYHVYFMRNCEQANVSQIMGNMPKNSEKNCVTPLKYKNFPTPKICSLKSFLSIHTDNIASYVIKYHLSISYLRCKTYEPSDIPLLLRYLLHKPPRLPSILLTRLLITQSTNQSKILRITSFFQYNHHDQPHQLEHLQK